MKSTLALLFAALATATCLQATISVNRYRINVTAPVTEAEIQKSRQDFLAQKGIPGNASMWLRNMDNAQLAAIVKTFPDLKEISVASGRTITALPSFKGTAYKKILLQGTPNLSDLTPLTECTSLEQLRLFSVGYKQLPKDFFLKLPNLNTLHLSGSYSRKAMPKLDLSGIEKASKLTFLDLTGNSPAPGDLAPVAAIPNLKELIFANIYDLDVAPLAKGCKNLRVLSLTSMKNPQNLQTLGDIPSIVRLTLGGRNPMDLSFLPKLPNLQTLKLTNCKPISLAPLGQCKQLANLNFNFVQNDLDLAQFTAQIAIHKKLKNIVFSHCNFINETALGNLEGCPLESLDLGYNPQKDKQPVDLSFLPKLAPTLTTLKLSRIHTTNFDQVKTCTNLYRLNADCKSFDLNAVKDLPKLKYIYVPKPQKQATQEAFKGRRVYVTEINVR